MKLWYVVLAIAVLTAMVMIPAPPEMRTAGDAQTSASTLSVLRLENAVSPIGYAARSPVSAYSSAHKPLEGMKICVDAGHGGQAQWSKTHYTGGTVGVATGQTESDVNLRVSLILKQYLEAAGATVIMTRTCDTRCQHDPDKLPELDFRSQMANARGADLFISVHHNESTRRDSNHTLVFYPSGMGSAVSLADNIASAVSAYLGTENLGAKPGSYRVLSGVRMPGVIVEASFMSNPAEDQRLASVAYNKLEAKAIATGILNYAKLVKGRQVDFNGVFAPIDDQASQAQAIADASFVRRQILERRSLFGVRYEEVTYDATGRITARREIGGNSLFASAQKARSSAKKVTAKVLKGKFSRGGKAQVSSSAKPSSKGKSTRIVITDAPKKTPKKVAEASSSRNFKPAAKSSASSSSKKSSSSSSKSRR